MTTTAARRRVLDELRRQLERSDYPRLHMAVILTIAGLGGFLASVALLHLGLRTMALRYGLAALAGYLAFLGGVRLWLAWQQRRLAGPRRDRSRWWDSVDVPTSSGDEVPEGPCAPAAAPDTGFELGDLVPDVDEGVAVLAVIALVGFLLVGLIGAVAILVGAPGLLAEVLLDGLIAGAAYRRLRDVPRQSWVDGVLARTWKPAAALTVTLMLVGLAGQELRPGADSIGDLFPK